MKEAVETYKTSEDWRWKVWHLFFNFQHISISNVGNKKFLKTIWDTPSWAWKEIPQMLNTLCSFLIFHPICVEIKISNLLSKWEWQKCPLITVCMKLAASSWRGVNLCYSCWQLNGTQNELRQKFRPLHSLGGLKQKRQQISKPGKPG